MKSQHFLLPLAVLLLIAQHSSGFITFTHAKPEPEEADPEPEPEPEPEPRYKPKKYYPKPEPEAEPAVHVNPKNIGLTFKFDTPGIKIQMPPFRLPGVSLKATLKQRHAGALFRLFPFNIGLPRIQFDASGGVGSD